MGRTETEKEKLWKEALIAKRGLDQAEETSNRDICLSPYKNSDNRGINISGEYLTFKSVLALRKDNCIFCNAKLDTIETISTNTKTHLDDNLETRFSESLVIKYVV